MVHINKFHGLEVNSHSFSFFVSVQTVSVIVLTLKSLLSLLSNICLALFKLLINHPSYALFSTIETFPKRCLVNFLLFIGQFVCLSFIFVLWMFQIYWLMHNFTSLMTPTFKMFALVCQYFSFLFLFFIFVFNCFILVI